MKLSHAVAALTVAAVAIAAVGSPISAVGSGLVESDSDSAAGVRPKPRPEPRQGRAATKAFPASAVVQRYCMGCHNPRQLRGNLSLQGYDLDSALARRDVSEKMIRKLRARMMPPPNASRKLSPDSSTLLATAIEQVIDSGARLDPGQRPFQRLNRAEYELAVRDLLDVQIDAGDFLPLDTTSANFDNIADVQSLSPTLLEAYLNAAAAVARMAIGDPRAAPLSTQYSASPFTSQHPWNRLDGA
ncbi:MAG: DUF1587 domain-containing protein, partial [Gemmatimonadaceae bacterium]